MWLQLITSSTYWFTFLGTECSTPWYEIMHLPILANLPLIGNFPLNVRIGKSTSVVLALQIPAFGPPLSNTSCRREKEGWGIVWRHGYRLANRVVLVARRIWAVGFDLEVGRYRPNFEFWQRVVQGRQENFIHANLPGVSRQRNVCACVRACVRALVGPEVTGLQQRRLMSLTSNWRVFPVVSISAICPVTKEDRQQAGCTAFKRKTYLMSINVSPFRVLWASAFTMLLYCLR